MTTQSEEIMMKQSAEDIKELQEIILKLIAGDKVDVKTLTFAPKPVKKVTKKNPTKVRTVKKDTGEVVKHRVEKTEDGEKVIAEKTIKAADSSVETKTPVKKDDEKKKITPNKRKINV